MRTHVGISNKGSVRKNASLRGAPIRSLLKQEIHDYRYPVPPPQQAQAHPHASPPETSSSVAAGRGPSLTLRNAAAAHVANCLV
jgi:hypothetical protein